MTEKAKSLVVIEDDIGLSYLIQDVAISVGFQTETIFDGEEALSYFRENVPNLIILDLHLPNVMGGDILQFIQDDKRFEDTKVIVITADSALQEDFARQTIALLKPFTVKELENILQN